MKNLLILSIASLALAGCGKGRSNNPFKALATAKDAPELQGTYESECTGNHKGWLSGLLASGKDILARKGPTDTVPSSERTQISFKGDSATIKEIHYIGNNCDGGEAYSFTEKGSFKVGDKDKNEKNNAGRYLDIKMKTVEVAILSESGAKFANTYGLCGDKNWKAGDSAKEVTDRAAQSDCYDVTPRRSIANVYQVDNSSLALGYTGSSANEKYPTSLDSKNVFTKK